MSAIKKVFNILTPKQKKSFYGLLVLLFLGMLFEITGLGVFIPALILIVDEKFAVDPYLSFFSEYGIKMTKIQFQILVVSLLIFFQLIKFFYMTFLTYRQQRYVANLSKYLSERLLEGYLNSPYRFHIDNNSSNLINNIQGELTHFIAVVQAFFMLLLEFLTIFGLLFLLFYVEFKGTLGVILILSISVLIFQKYAKNRLLKFGTIRTNNLHLAVKNLSNTLSSIKEVKIAGRENFFLNKFKYFNNQSIDALSKKETLQYIPKYYLEFVSFCSLAGLILALLIQNQSIQSLLPTIGIFAGAAFRILPSVNRVLNSMQLVKFSEPTINKLYDEFKSFNSSLPLTEKQEVIDPLIFNHTIRLSNITYSYSKDGTKIFDDISLTIQKNECIGIIGKSGSGKSTFLNILLGLLELGKGKIYIDNTDLFNCRESWLKSIGYVPQSICLIDDTIANNIAFGLAPEQIDYKRLESVCRDAQILEFIERMPQKFDSEVGERGVKISGGQLQRIGIARALYNNPSVLVFDEATSSLDSVTERDFVKCVQNIKKNKTIIFITHRDSTLHICDRVVALQDGKFIEKSLIK